MRSPLVYWLLAGGLLGGCHAEAQYGGGARTIETSTPDLVRVGPGVQVIADYDYPVFYASGAYWRYDNDTWYHSNLYTGGWAYAGSPPTTIAHLDRPASDVHARPTSDATHRPARPQRDPVVRRGPTRDHGD